MHNLDHAVFEPLKHRFVVLYLLGHFLLKKGLKELEELLFVGLGLLLRVGTYVLSLGICS